MPLTVLEQFLDESITRGAGASAPRGQTLRPQAAAGGPSSA
jgi:hypothetical protein